jgi:hypothetical protein
MAKVKLTISSIFNGMAPSAMFGTKDEYQLAIGIDPDMPLSDQSTDIKTGGCIRPVNYTAFSDTAVTSYPIAILTTPKTALVYVVLANGRLISYTSAFATETLIGTVAGGVASGALYYNNYIYIMTPTNVSRYGPLDGTAALVDSVWTGATLGSLTALTNTTYPNSLMSVPYLNHFGVTHIDNNIYFLDFLNGKGMVHAIKTKKTTAEGDTNDGSAYNIVNLPMNYLPISISSYGENLVVSACFTSNGTIIQGKAALFFFNPADTVKSFYQAVNLPDTICSGLKYINGILYGLSGDLNGGYRIFRYAGGETIQTLKIIEEGNPPLQGAVAAIGNRIVWAADTTTPVVASGLYGYGSKSDLFPRGLHNICVTTF